MYFDTFLDANLFKEAFEEAQRIIEQNRNLPDEETSDENDETESDEEDEEVKNDIKESNSESDVVEQLNALKVGNAPEKNGLSS